MYVLLYSPDPFSSFQDYGMAYGFGSILPAVTVSHLFTQHFHFSTLVIGLAYGGSLTIGGIIGELGGGIVVDRIIKRERQKRGENVEPEVRLKAIWTGEILVPVSPFSSPKPSPLLPLFQAIRDNLLPECTDLAQVGLLMYRFGVQYKLNFMMPVGFPAAELILERLTMLFFEIVAMGIAMAGVQVITTVFSVLSVPDPLTSPILIGSLCLCH
jgi:MFS family permease